MRVGRKRVVGRALFAVGVLTSAALLAASPAEAQPAPDPEAELNTLRQRADQARREANDAAESYTNAQSSFEDLGNKIAELEQKIAQGEARRQELRAVAERRAVLAYKNLGSDRDVVLEAKNPTESARTSVLLDRATRPTTPPSPRWRR